MLKFAFSILVLFGGSSVCLAAPAGRIAEQTFAPTTRFLKVSDGLYRGAAPASRSEVQALKAIGIRTFINLASSTDIQWESREAELAGITVVNLPLPYFWKPDSQRMAQIEFLLNDRSLYPIYVHCRQGRDRTGLVVGLHRVFTQGWSPDEAYQEMKKLGFRSIFIGLKEYFEDATKTEIEDGHAIDVGAS